jgi:hypothetical protein
MSFHGQESGGLEGGLGSAASTAHRAPSDRIGRPTALDRQRAQLEHACLLGVRVCALRAITCYRTTCRSS